jgi:hypothetical protein
MGKKDAAQIPSKTIYPVHFIVLDTECGRLDLLGRRTVLSHRLVRNIHSAVAHLVHIVLALFDWFRFLVGKHFKVILF